MRLRLESYQPRTGVAWLEEQDASYGRMKELLAVCIVFATLNMV